MELKRVVTYLKNRPREELIYKMQYRDQSPLSVYVDSDWARELTTRISTTGMILMRGDHCLRHSSTLQKAIALSSAEAEYYAMTKGGAYALGTRAYFEALGRCDQYRGPVLRQQCRAGLRSTKRARRDETHGNEIHDREKGIRTQEDPYGEEPIICANEGADEDQAGGSIRLHWPKASGSAVAR